jgi:hypothetical protein
MSLTYDSESENESNRSSHPEIRCQVSFMMDLLGAAMTDQQPRYLAYMLRLWEARTGGEQVWRASLESPHTGERQAFASLEELFALLREQTGSSQTETAGPWTEPPKADEKGVNHD